MSLKATTLYGVGISLKNVYFLQRFNKLKQAGRKTKKSKKTACRAASGAMGVHYSFSNSLTGNTASHMSGASESTFLSGYPNYKISSGIRATCYWPCVAVAAWIYRCTMTKECLAATEAWKAKVLELQQLADISAWYTLAYSKPSVVSGPIMIHTCTHSCWKS